jgi:hypothetical protein
VRAKKLKIGVDEAGVDKEDIERDSRDSETPRERTAWE